jgi:hypothetical protein
MLNLSLSERLFLVEAIISSYKNSFDRLVDAILSRIEREDMAYQKALSEALEERFTELGNIEAMTAEDACDRIRSISDRALEEL